VNARKVGKESGSAAVGITRASPPTVARISSSSCSNQIAELNTSHGPQRFSSVPISRCQPEHKSDLLKSCRFFGQIPEFVESGFRRFD